MERNIGETFWDNGIRVQCISANDNTCVGCCYASTRYSIGTKLCIKNHGYVGSCSAKDREDKTDVKFIAIG